MDVAISTLATILALIPGFVFWSGMHARASGFVEEDITSWRTPGQLARIVVTAVAIHIAFFLYISLMFWCAQRWGLCDTNFTRFLHAHLQWNDGAPWWKSPEHAQRSVDAALTAAGYLVATTYIAYELGKWVSRWSLIAIRPLMKPTGWKESAGYYLKLKKPISDTRAWARDFARKFVVHKFVYDLIEQIQKNNLVMAYVLAKHKMNDKSIVYRGWLNDMHYDRSGKLTYIVVKNMSKMECVEIGGASEVGATDVAVPPKSSAWQHIGPNEHSVGYFMGDSIENLVLDWKEPSSRAPTDENKAKQVAERIAQTLSAIGPALDKAIADLKDSSD